MEQKATSAMNAEEVVARNGLSLVASFLEKM